MLSLFQRFTGKKGAVMKEFGLYHKCIKCGFDNANRIPDIEYKTGIFDTQFQQSISSSTFSEKNYPDYLLRTCRQCGYKWPERTIDS